MKKSLLESYYNQHYSAYDSEIEWYVDPAPDVWLFEIPSLHIRVKLTELPHKVIEQTTVMTSGYLTENEILSGLRSGHIQLVTDPNMESGTVCQIGGNWFYFGGQTAEQMTPEEYLRCVPEEDIVCEIAQTLDAFRKDPSFVEEYLYYLYYLREIKKE